MTETNVIMKAYIGTKIIKASPMIEATFLKNSKGLDEKSTQKKFIPGESRPGYLVIYDNGYQSWSPKDVFEAAYRLVNDNEKNLVKE